LFIRAGDFFGPGAHNTWLYHMAKSARRGGTLLSPAQDGSMLHEWAYLPDLAAVTVRLMDREDSPSASYHFAGHLVSLDELFALVAQAVARPDLPRRGVPWRAVSVLAPFMPSLRMLRDTRYQWEHCIRLDDRKLRDRLGALPYTPLHEAVRATVATFRPTAVTRHVARTPRLNALGSN
jgi:nucleoside-diphosphate-sugar epimerase